ncbi:uncharacterized protein F4807DRAFT_4666 [Annulohypoxylon truncatum]|uniref:uncharacterized protein n=1 Tax=Annulohypoxylon truncatum TaxID=327061 RepID=UPI00200898C6|nr:uncharacterized protein F4807DRAFT_4666 [Annulohypoxylon truncatum]KAI1214646.1 hypothetical protein F4807DRAFT_4666 [Annulohypoxylon truncatum]
MKAPLLFTLSFLAPSILASTNHATTSASQPIFVLKTSQTATSVLSKALGKLGYIHQEARQGNYSASSTPNINANTNTYVEVTSDAQLLEISRAHPEAKFIIPSGSQLFSASEDGAPGSWWGRQRASGAELVGGEGGGIWFAQDFLSEKNENEKLDEVLELDVLALEKGAQAENWVRLCDFLGLGYSVVERLSLWHFPQ